MKEINSNNILSYYYNMFDSIVTDYNPTIGSSLEEYLLANYRLWEYELTPQEKEDIDFVKKNNIEPMKF